MVVLVVWEMHPEETSFHLVPYQEKWMKLHGKFRHAEDVTEEEEALIAELDRIKGDPTPSCDISGMGVTHFIQTGWLL
jgi:hypothetical protein